MSHLMQLAWLAANKFSGKSKSDLLQKGLSDLSSVPRIYRTWAKQELEKLEQMGGSCISWEDSAYPRRFFDLADPPPLLFALGSLPELSTHTVVAVVGSRKCSVYGENVARELGENLSQAGCCLVSGLAYGIDEAAHRGFGSGRQIAVIGGGFSNISPKRNIKLARAIVEEGGAVLSEHAPSVWPHPLFFPARNRLISALSDKTVVVEARKKSGSLITADFSLDLGREVYAVPGPINSTFNEGTNKLLEQGAAPYLSFESLATSLKLAKPTPVQMSSVLRNFPAEAQAIVQQLRTVGMCSFEQLCEDVQQEPHKLRSMVTQLELSGVLKTTNTDYVIYLK